MTVPVFITYRDRRTMLQKTLISLVERGFTNITVIDNGSEHPLIYGADHWQLADTNIRIVHADNTHRQLAPWLLNLVPDDSYYVVMDCDNELVCPNDVESVLIDALERYPQIEKLGLGIKTDDLLFPPPEHYAYSYLMEYSVERGMRYKTIGYLERPSHMPMGGVGEIIDAPIDTTFAMYRPGHGWPGIVGARTLAPYHIRHLSWYNAEYTEEEKLYYAHAGNAWTLGHSAGSLLDTTVAVPFTALRQETVIALNKEQVRYAPMPTVESYWELLRDLWADGRSFVIVEHDIVVNETTIDELKSCDHDWCAMPFHYRGNDHAYALACTKISADLIRRHPQVPEVLAGMSDALHPPKHWCRLDAWLFALLNELGEKRHNHFWATPLQHVGPQFPQHGCLEIAGL